MNTNIVEIKVKNQSIIRTRPLYQWDSGQILKVIDHEIPDNTEVQFGSACMQPSVSAFIANNQVKIPQAAMEQPMEIIAYMVIVEPDSETTVKEIRIPMRPKPKPSDYVPEEDVPSIMQVIQRKADKGGWTPNMYLGTDAEGNMVEKDAPSGGDSGATAEQLEQIETNKQNIESLSKDFSRKADKATTLAGYGITDGATKSDVSQLSGKIANQQAQIDAKQPKGNYLTTETDPTVPAWAKAANKPTYTADEVGARPSTWTPSASEVGADPAGTAAGTVSSHNTAEDAHADIRLLVTGLTNRMNALADSDDETLDQVSELVAYIKANRSLIEQITTGKVSVSDIVDNLTTNVANKPLSAAQGVKLKALIDAISVPTKVSQLTNDSGYLTEHQDISGKANASDLTSHTGNTTVHITTAERTKWNQAVTDVGTLSEEIADLQGGVVSVPDYWVSELEAKADAIQVAMEKAGRNKSAFLWYTDAHWANGNSKKSPMILDYLYRNTPMNKTKFGGDIIGDTLLATREEMKYLYEWRRMIRDIRNHHSVFGNHDMFNLDSVDYENDNYRYAFLLAPEETADMVWGDGNYYYIDNPAEKTRYLHLAYLTSDLTAMLAQGQWIADAIKSVPEGWHIVAIAHRWWQYSSSSTPTTGSIPTYEAEMLDVFDKYNARATRSGSNYFYAQDFKDAKGKVEFCIGGHIHVDHDFFTAGGIPVIITTADANQNRVPDSTVDSGTTGTITEAAVFGIIADYNEDVTKITVVGVGRGTSRVVRASTVTPTSISNISYTGDTTVESAIDKAKFSFTVNYSDGSTSSVTGANTVSPATIEVVGDNTVTITYIENGVTLTGTVTIVGTAKPTVNLFNQNDPDVLLRGRINSSGNAVEYADNQVLSGYIEAKPGDIFTVTSDKANNANPYTGSITAFKSDKTYMAQMNSSWTGIWNWSGDYLTGTLTIPTGEYNGVDFANTAYVRVCMAYYDLDNIVITKS